MSVQLSPDCESPQVRAKLQLFLLFAAATRDNLVFAYENLPNRYLLLITAIAECLVEFIEKFDEHSTPDNVWKSVLASPGVLKLPKKEAKSVFEKFEASLTANSANADLYSSYLGGANRRALEWIHNLGKLLSMNYDVSPLELIQERPLHVALDEHAVHACASSTRSGPIMWSFQVKPFAFYGAVFAELILVHEYLCHVMPPNRYLERDIREVWLNSCISFGIRNLDPAGEREPAKLVWLLFRNGYAAHFNIPPFSVGGSLSIDDLTSTLLGRPLFWKITLAILATPDGQAESDTISLVFNALSRCTDLQLSILQDGIWNTLSELLAFLNSIVI
jgi:hypothetical protein